MDDSTTADSPSNDPQTDPVVDPNSDHDMPALVAHSNPALLPTATGVNKRYRPAPAKTFQCRGYGECRMVFSRSEHLARHIRKHTGERPFTCHCGKQFSRLDNLRQHAQTVHADKQDQNERMMRELTSLHASMAAANKAGQSRGKRGQANAAALPAASNHSLPQDNPALHSLDLVKEEDQPSLPIHQRPGTSTGYEGTDSILYHSDHWSDDLDRSDTRAHNSHSFRDSTQSFLAPPSASSPFLLGSHSQSFLPFPTNSFNIGLSSRDGRPRSSSSRPPTAGGTDSHARTLPPLSAVVSASIPTSQSQSFPLPPQSTQHILPLSGTLAFNRRPSTATRPGTAPAAYYNPKPAYAGGPGLVHQPELSLPHYGRAPELAAAAAAAYRLPYDPEPTSPSAASYDSPFSFHPPALTDPLPPPSQQQQQPAQGGPLASSPPNPRKRPFPGADGFDDPPRSSGSLGEYEYGSESRPQSRRLSVLELCNDPDADPGVRSFIPSGATGSTSRPTTSSGLVSSASALALVDRAPVPGHALLTGTAPPAAGAAPSTAAAATAYGASAQTFGGGGVLATVRRDLSPTSSSPAASVFSTYRGTYSASPLSDTSRSPRSQPSSAAFAAAAARSAVGLHSGSPSPSDAAAAALSRRGGESQRDQVRISVGSPHTPAAVGMRV